MKCPQCGQEMEAGHVIGKIPWLPEDAKHPLIWSKRAVESAGGIMLTNPYVRSIDGVMPTQLCKACKIGYFHYHLE